MCTKEDKKKRCVVPINVFFCVSDTDKERKKKKGGLDMHVRCLGGASGHPRL